MKLLSIGEAARTLGVSIATLRRWEKLGKIRTIRSESGHRRYSITDIKETFTAQAPVYRRSLPVIEAAPVYSPLPQPQPEPAYTPQPVVETPQTVHEQTTVEFLNTSIKSPILLSEQRSTLMGIFVTLLLLSSTIVISRLGIPAAVFGVLGLQIEKPEISTRAIAKNIGSGEVLASHTGTSDFLFRINVPTEINNNAEIGGTLVVTGDVTAPNLVYSVTAGDGIEVTGDQNVTITNTDPGSAQLVFKTFKIGSTEVSAGSNDDTFTFAEGNNIDLSINTSTNTLTISGDSIDPTSAGWTDEGSTVRLTTAGDIVSIGSATGSAKLSLENDLPGDVFTASQSGNLLLKLSNTGLFNLTATGFTAGFKLQNSSTFFSGVGAPDNSNGQDGDFYFRTDAPDGNSSTYVKVGGSWTTSGGGSTSLQDAYNSGNTILTTNNRDLAITLANTAIDSNLLVNIASGSTGSFQVQNNGSTVTTLDTAGINTNDLTTNGNTILGSNSSDTITANGYFGSSLIPNADVTYDLGSPTNRWNAIYANTIVSGGSGVSGHWQRNAGALSPSNVTDDLLLGSIATGSAQISLSGTTGNGTFTGTVQMSGFRLTTGAGTGYALISDGSGNGNWTDISSSGTAGPWTLSGQSLYPDSASYKLLLGSITASDAIGQFNVSGQVAGKALSIINYTGTDQNILTASASGVTKYTLDASGNASQSGNLTFDSAGFLQTTRSQLLTIGGSSTGNIELSPQAGAGKVNVNGTLELTALRLTTGPGVGYFMTSDGVGNASWTNTSGSGTFGNWTLTGNTLYPSSNAYDVLIGSTDTTTDIGKLNVNGAKTGKALVVLNETGNQNILVASAAGVNKLVLSNAGQLGLGTTVPAADIDITSAAGNLLTMRYSTNVMAFTQSSGGFTALDVSAPTNARFSLSMNSTTTALYANALGQIGIGNNTSPLSTLDVRGLSGTTAVASASGQTAFAALVTNNNGVGDLFTASQSGWTRFKIAGDGSIAQNANALSTGLGYDLTSIATTLTSGGLANFSWIPGSSTTASGDLFRLKIGPNGSTTGNLFNILDDTTSLFSVSESQITSNLPHSFTGTGDVTIANDLNFSNPTAAYISFTDGPGYIRTTHPSGSNDLTLSAANRGDVYIADSLVVAGAQTGRAMAVFNEIGDQAILTGSASGVTQFTFSRTGDLALTGDDLTTASTTFNLLNTTATTINFGAAANTINMAGGSGSTGCTMDGTTGNFTCSGNIVSGTTGVAGYWQRNAGVVSPNFITDDLTLGATATASALFRAAGTAVNGVSLSVVNNTATTIGVSDNTTGLIDFDSSSLTTGTMLNLNSSSLTTGKLFNAYSTSTGLTTGSLGRFNWEPTTPATASGDLVLINIGAAGDTTGNLFNITDAGSSLFSVSTAGITSGLPHSFTAAGDVSMAYDLIFTNQTSSHIKSYGPLYIESGESFENNDLNLKTYGTGNAIFDLSGTGGVQIVGQKSGYIFDVLNNDGFGSGEHFVANFGKGVGAVNAVIIGYRADGSIKNGGFVRSGDNTPLFLGTSNNGLALTINDTTTATAAAVLFNSSTGTDADGLAIKLGQTTPGSACNTSGGACNEYITFLNGNGVKLGKIHANSAAPTITYKANGLDFAEFFTKNNGESFTAGDVVTLSNNNATKATSGYDSKVIGIVSDAPSFAGGVEGEDKVLVGLVGQVKVRMSQDSSPVAKGDFLTSSTDTGKATRANHAGFMVGKALEDWAPGQETIMAFISPVWADPDNQLAFDNNGNLAIQGQVTAQDFKFDGLANSINDRLSIINTEFANLHSEVDTLTSDIASISAELATLRMLVDGASGSGSYNDYWDLATESGKLATIYDVQTANLDVIGKLTVGLLSFDDLEASISSLTGEITINGDLAISGKVRVLGSSIGEAILPAGETEIVIASEAVSSASAIFVTPNVAIAYPLAVTDSTPGASFKVEVSLQQYVDVPFKWWIVN